MTTDEPNSTGDVHNNDVGGSADNVVQAATIHGGVHFNQFSGKANNARPKMRRSATVALVLSGALALGGVVWLVGMPTRAQTPVGQPAKPSPSPQEVHAHHIARCEADHHLASQSDRIDSPGGASFRSCTWPPAPHADGDGFTAITAEHVARPGACEASGATAVDRITGPCHTFRLAYDFGSQGALEHRAPFDVGRGIVTSVDDPGVPWQEGIDGLDFYPERNEVDVVHNDNSVLVSAACVD